jgi:DNA-binding PucR family transcriptional regulator
VKLAAQAHADLLTRLQDRHGEIEQSILTRVHAISDPREAADPQYAEGLRVAVSSALQYGLLSIERGEDRAPPIPTPLLAQARLAARHGISLDTVLRRYFAGYTLLGDFLVEEAASDRALAGDALQRLLRTQATLFDRLLAAVSEEYSRETEGRLNSAEERRAERLQRLLAGEMVDTAELAYDFERFHLGLIAKGPGASKALGELGDAFDCRMLSVRRDEGVIWAWLGSRGQLDPVEVQRCASVARPASAALALGEPSAGLAGWRLTHRQAKATLPFALQSPQASARYADVALLATVLGDDLLATSLRELYLAPLAGQRDGGAALRETLRAYLAAGHNVSCAASALGASRQTVRTRLGVVEDLIGRALDTCAAEMNIALRLEEASAEPLVLRQVDRVLPLRPND